VWRSLPDMTRRWQFHEFDTLWCDKFLPRRGFEVHFADFAEIYQTGMKRWEEKEMLARLYTLVATLYPLHLSTYVLLWICNWIPFYDLASEFSKVKTIERVRQHCDEIVARRKK
jgi:hypothetical protein